MNRLDEYGYAGLYKALKHKYKYALSTNLPCVSRNSQFLVLLCIFPELISLQESCGSRFRLISRLFGCLKCLLLLIVRHIPEIRNDHPSLVVKVAKSFCKNTEYCSAISLSFTNISGGAAPILASVIGVSPKTWRISASADARSTPYGSSA